MIARVDIEEPTGGSEGDRRELDKVVGHGVRTPDARGVDPPPGRSPPPIRHACERCGGLLVDEAKPPTLGAHASP
jgi:hypothetical protein